MMEDHPVYWTQSRESVKACAVGDTASGRRMVVSRPVLVWQSGHIGLTLTE